MSEKLASLSVLAGVAAASLTSFALPVGTANAAAPTSNTTQISTKDSSTSHEYCAVLLSTRSGSSDAVEAAKSCSGKSMSAAKAGLGPLSSTHLMTAYSNLDFSGTTWDYYGSAGTCDSAGYSWTPSSWWQTHLSSIRGYGDCRLVDLYTRSMTYAEYSWFLPLDFGGMRFNDNTGKVHIHA
jgi:hypothetical protein